MVKSDLRVWHGDLHITSLRGSKEGDGQAIRRGSKVKAENCGKIDPIRGEFIAPSANSCLDMSAPQKFAARRAEKFQEQGGRLSLAALELTYLFAGITHAPRDVVAKKMLPQVRSELKKLNASQHNPETWGNGKGYWDDYCLCRFLEGVCERYLAFPVRLGVLSPMTFIYASHRIQTPW